jgi:SAM-dependent methyltransferase
MFFENTTPDPHHAIFWPAHDAGRDATNQNTARTRLKSDICADPLNIIELLNTMSDATPMLDPATSRKRTRCRACGAPLTCTVVDLGAQPPCNSIVSLEHFNDAEAIYPLRVMVCSQCLLVQLETDISPASIYTEYAYFSSFSDSWLDHARRYVEMMCSRMPMDASKQVVELASNDGYLLQFFIQKGIPAYGVDPAVNVAQMAEARGVPTVVAFFGASLAESLKRQGRQADLIVANNVLGHIPDINDFVAGMKILLKAGGVITIEIPHFMRLMEFNQFDTIYHEHYCYHTLHADMGIFSRHGLRLFDVQEMPTHGGSIRMFVCHDDDPRDMCGSVNALMQIERARGLHKPETYVNFGEVVKATKFKLLSFLIEAKRAGKHIAGYGAPGKGSTLFNFCGIREDFIDYVVDRNPYKQGKFMPGSRIPIFAPNKINETRPDYLLILPWNIKDEVIRQMSCIREWGGQFVEPIPEVRVLQ